MAAVAIASSTVRHDLGMYEQVSARRLHPTAGNLLHGHVISDATQESMRHARVCINQTCSRERARETAECEVALSSCQHSVDL